MSKILIPTNEYNTPITEELLNEYPDYVREQFMDFIDTVPLLRWMISEDRPRAIDLPRDEKGRIIVDISHPHILEDMDYFRPAALFYKENGCFSFLKPNQNKNSEYGKWFYEEVRRCREGYVRESDGEWIPGYLYWYLNYSPIMLNKQAEGSNVYYRVEDFPDFWEGIYYRFHYIEQARRFGKHSMELSRRGSGKSFSLASIMSHNLILGENQIAKDRVTTVLTAYTKEYLTEKDGTFSKFTPMIGFTATHTEFPRMKLKASPSEMIWKMGYKTETGDDAGSQNAVMGLSVKDDEGKVRGKRGWILFEEMGCHLKGTEVLMHDGSVKKVEDIRIGDVLMGDDGEGRTVSEVHHGFDMMYNVELTNGDKQIVNSNHLVPYIVRDWYRDTDTRKLATAPELMAMDLKRGFYIEKAVLSFPHKEVPIDPYIFGLWLGDGDKRGSIIYNPDKEIEDVILSHFPDTRICDLPNTDKCKKYYIPAKYGIRKKLSKYNLFNNKHIPDIYIYNSEDILLELLAGFIDTDGYYNKTAHSHNFEIIQSVDHLQILKSVRRIALSLGFRCSLKTKISGSRTKKPNTLYYRLNISGDISRIPTRVNRKKADKNEQKYKQRRHSNYYGFKVSEYGYGEFFGFTVDKNHQFLLEDLTVTHNSFPTFKDTWDNVRDSVKEGDRVFSLLYAVGTAGDDESDFSGVRTMLYNPDAYEVYALENVYDKSGKGASKFAYFFPSYISRAGCMDKDGNSDVVKALLEILKERWVVKQGGDSASLLKRIANMPITPEEAILKVQSNFFPVVMLNERLRQLDTSPRTFDDVYVGTLVNTGTQVMFKKTDDIPIRKWTNNPPKEDGAMEIFVMPQGTPPSNRYIIGVDPVDNDQARSESLFSFFVFDLFTDEIVAEYTGRKQLAEDGYELVRLAALFWNAMVMYESNRKMMYSYFSKMRSTYLLADCPEYLKSRGLIKYSLFGSSVKGITVNGPIIGFALDLLKDWLMETCPIDVQAENGDVHTEHIPKLYRIRNRALLQEMISYGPNVNTDRVSAMFQVMLYREHFKILFGGAEQRSENIKDDADDDFFNKDWDNLQRRLSMHH